MGHDPSSFGTKIQGQGQKSQVYSMASYVHWLMAIAVSYYRDIISCYLVQQSVLHPGKQ